MQNITEFVNRAHHTYFKVKLGALDKSWATHKVHKFCVELLRSWSKGKEKHLPFGIPMIGRESKTHFNDCYFCMVNVMGCKKSDRHLLNYPNWNLLFNQSLIEVIYLYQYSQSFSDSMMMKMVPIRKKLKEKNLLHQGTKVTLYRYREHEFQQYFCERNGLVFCPNVEGPLLAMGVPNYNPSDWRLFIDSFKRSLKCVLLHNGNIFGSIPIGYSVKLKEEYNYVKEILEVINYSAHDWVIWVDLKMVNFLLGQQSGFTKFPLFSLLLGQ
ncbi:hypothetical protein LOD99_7508 [Oopsacas minuta]|uniref:Uncharacterized protein n=1 Tax=Oopsacas minuta TaxID=111878 RepID=A0AAV7JVJ3_9METZ|nr:hypothetical protein LOD99_7508 [Oopsacas minuta]